MRENFCHNLCTYGSVLGVKSLERIVKPAHISSNREKYTKGKFV